MSSNETASDSSASSKVYTEDMLPTIICNGRFRVQYDKEGATRGIPVVDVNAALCNDVYFNNIEAALKILNEKKK